MKLILILFFMLLCAYAEADQRALLGPNFYSMDAREREVFFSGIFRSELRSVHDVAALTVDQRLRFQKNQIEPTLKFIFGPLTYRGIGGPQSGLSLKVDWSSARLIEGRVLLNYEYTGVWLVNKDMREIVIPVPFNKKDLFTSGWKFCTDSAPNHQTEWFYWYFWDPSRRGCEHRDGVHYQTAQVQLGKETENQIASYPEYEKLFRSTDRENQYQMTFAFGYAEDPQNPNPENDWDEGVQEYRSFVDFLKQNLGFRESLILQKEYRRSRNPDRVIGHRFIGRKNDVNIVINVVAAAGVDQMELFAKSFAHDHDGFFGWFGHSRVGSGFDADRFWQMVSDSPDYYSVTSNYQMIYWAGCNSYSYYTLPFFEFKAKASNGTDPNGTKGLDIIANGLPSFFSLNATNAAVVLKHLLNWQARPSYQTIVNEIEDRGREAGITVLAVVLGDEDNE